MDFDPIVWVSSGWIVRATTRRCQAIPCRQSSPFACWVLFLSYFLLVHILVASLLTALSAAVLGTVARGIHATRTSAVDATVLRHDEVLIHYIRSVISSARLKMIVFSDSVRVQIGDVLCIIL